MKKIIFLSLASLFLLNSCEKDEEAPVVNIASEDKGEVISFSAEQGLTFFEPTDTFILLSGGIPPYVIESSDIVNTYINEDTLFFPIRESSFPLVVKITVSDNRGYNRSQFRYIAMPSEIDLDVDNGNNSDIVINRVDETGANVISDVISNPSITYLVKEKVLRFGSNNEKLSFSVDLNNGNEDPSFITYLESNFGFFISYSKDAPSSVKLTYDAFNIPKTLEFDLNVAEPAPGVFSYNLKTARRYQLD